MEKRVLNMDDLGAEISQGVLYSQLQSTDA